MFEQMKPLLLKGTTAVMTVSMVTDEIMRLTINVTHPEDLKGEDVNKPRLQSVVFEATPAELDDPSISFTPMVVAYESLNDAIQGAAAASIKAAPKRAPVKTGEQKEEAPAPPAPAGAPAGAAVAPKNPPPKGRSKAAVAPTVPTPPAEPTETDAARELREQAEHEEAERKRVEKEEEEKKRVAQAEVEKKKAAKKAEIERLTRELADADSEQPGLGT